MKTDPLYGFQNTAATRIARSEQVYLGFDPGLGKSRTALQGARLRGATRILVVCHASGRYVWEEQVRLWTDYTPIIVRNLHDLKGKGVFILTYGLVSQSGSPFVAAISGKGVNFDMTILDEAAALKSPSSNRTKGILEKMLPNLGYVVPLSGTPAPNHAGELYSILRALYPKSLIDGSGKALTRWEFEDRYCKVVLKKFGQGNPIRVIEGSRNLDELKVRIAPFMMRVRKEAVLKDLPSVRYDVVPIGVDSNAAKQLPTIPGQDNDDTLLAFLNGKLGDEHVMRLRRMLGLLKVNPALEYLDDFLEGLPANRKILVFAHHREVVESLMQGLGDYSPVKIDGGSSFAERTRAVDTFLTRSQCRVFVGNIQAAGTGLTLVGPQCRCSDVFFVEASYAVGDNVQAAARVHRIGQSDAVVARFLTAHGTIDDRIQAILARKAKDFSQLFDGATA